MLCGALTTLRPATASDIGLLVEWHSDPEVARFWDWETYTREEMQARLDREDVRSFVVEEAATPLGYIQAWSDDGWQTAGLDMFLVPRARARGLGSDAAERLARHLVHECRCSRVTSDPYVWNSAAVRAWKRAGFAPQGERPPDADHSAPWLLMTYVGR